MSLSPVRLPLQSFGCTWIWICCLAVANVRSTSTLCSGEGARSSWLRLGAKLASAATQLGGGGAASLPQERLRVFKSQMAVDCLEDWR